MVDTIDGFQTAVADIRDNTCCPPNIKSYCETDIACDFLNLLPNGPMWDTGKREAQDWLASGRIGTPQRERAHLAYHAAYTGDKMQYLLNDVLWPALRESNPETAVTTLDDWLDRLGWQECYTTCGTRVGGCNPYRYEGPCGYEFAECVPPVDLNDAVKRAIVISLYRLQKGMHRTLSAINWVIQPLGATLSYDPDPVCIDCDTGVIDSLPALEGTCCRPTLRLDPLTDLIDQVPNKECVAAALLQIDNFYDCDVGGTIKVIRPALLAAECIVRAMFTPGNICRITIRRDL